METYHILGALVFVFLILEIFLPGFIAGSLAMGFLFAALASYLGLNIEWQITLFAIGVLLAFLTIRPLIMKFGYRNHEKTKTNQQALIGRKVKVVELIDNKADTGRVAVDGDIWKARSADEKTIPVNSYVEIIKIESIILYVKPLNQ